MHRVQSGEETARQVLQCGEDRIKDVCSATAPPRQAARTTVFRTNFWPEIRFSEAQMPLRRRRGGVSICLGRINGR